MNSWKLQFCPQLYFCIALFCHSQTFFLSLLPLSWLRRCYRHRLYINNYQLNVTQLNLCHLNHLCSKSKRKNLLSGIIRRLATSTTKLNLENHFLAYKLKNRGNIRLYRADIHEFIWLQQPGSENITLSSTLQKEIQIPYKLVDTSSTSVHKQAQLNDQVWENYNIVFTIL